MSRLARVIRLFRKPTPEPVPVVSGPSRIYVRRTPLGAELDVSDFIERLVRQLASDFVEATEEIGDDLIEIAKLDASAAHERGRGNDDSYAEHARDALVERFLSTIGGGALLLDAGQVRSVAGALMAAGQVTVLPGQRGVA